MVSESSGSGDVEKPSREEEEDEEEPNLIKVYEGDIEFYIMEDPVFESEVYVIKTPERTFFGTNIKDVLKEFLSKDPRTGDERYVKIWVKFMFAHYAKRIRGHVIGGFYPDGYTDGLVPYPVRDWSCNPKSLEDIANYINTNYPLVNRKVALANVALAIASVFSPAIKLYRKTYEDRIVINTGPTRVGKTRLFESIINLLGLIPDKVYFSGDLVVKTPERVKKLLTASNAPLFLDDIGVEGLKSLASVSFDDEFKALRSVMVNTRLPVETLRQVLRKIDDSAWTKRVLILQWSNAPLPVGVRPWEGKPIMGCLRELWQGHDPNSLPNMQDLTDLSRLSDSLNKGSFL